MALLPKKYLRIYDVAEYLNDLNVGYEYDLHESFDRNKLNDDIYDLVAHGELKAVFKSFTIDFEEAYLVVYDKQLKSILGFNNTEHVASKHQIYCYADGKKPENNKSIGVINDHGINFDDIYIPKEELDALFNLSKVNNSEQQRIAELQSELAQVKAQLEEQQQAPQRTRAQTDETNTDKKLIAMLAILLAKQSNTFRIGDRPNATQINEQVLNLTMQIVDELGMNENDMLGLKANTDKISKAVQAYADMFKLSKD